MRSFPGPKNRIMQGPGEPSLLLDCLFILLTIQREKTYVFCKHSSINAQSYITDFGGKEIIQVPDGPALRIIISNM